MLLALRAAHPSWGGRRLRRWLQDQGQVAPAASTITAVTATVQDRLIAAFRLYGLPGRINLDDPSPWGNGPGEPCTPPTVWLLRLG